MRVITDVVADDRAEWLELWNGYLMFYEATVDDSTTEATFERLTDERSDIHGAIARDDDGAAVGLVHWLTHPATWTSGTYCYLEDLFVLPIARRHGIGRALIEHVREWATDNGSAKVYWLTAESNTAARRLYEDVAQRTGMLQYQIPLS